MYTVERTIEDVEFDERTIEELRAEIQHDLLEEGKPQHEEKIEKRLEEKLVDLAWNRTLFAQGDADLHLDIDVGEVKEE